MKKGSTLYVLSFMAIICMVFGTAIAMVHHLTRDLLEKNESLAKNRALCRAFQLEVPGASAEAYQQAISLFLKADSLHADGRKIEVYTDTRDSSVGFVFSGVGFWDIISGIVVLSGDLATIKNMQVLKQHETPGLGARIEEPWFTGQFKGLSVAWHAQPQERIIIGSSLISGRANRVDGITGATQTSVALMQTLNNDLELFAQAYSRRK